MTSKTIKTILFAGLIAAMILPFSNMDFADADKGDKNKEQQEKISKLKKSISENKELKDKTKDNKKKDKLSKDITILENILDLEVLDSKGLGNSEVAKLKLNLITQMIDEEYETHEAKQVDPSEVPVVTDVDYLEQIVPMAFAGQYDTYTTTQQVSGSCGVTEVGQISGYVYQNTHDSYIKMTTHDYPDTLHCPEYDYKDTTGVYTKIGVGGSCSITFANNDASVITYCDQIGTNNDPLTVTTIFITGNSYYDWGWVYFTATPGWAAIVYQ